MSGKDLLELAEGDQVIFTQEMFWPITNSEMGIDAGSRATVASVEGDGEGYVERYHLFLHDQRDELREWGNVLQIDRDHSNGAVLQAYVADFLRKATLAERTVITDTFVSVHDKARIKQLWLLAAIERGTVKMFPAGGGREQKGDWEMFQRDFRPALPKEIDPDAYPCYFSADWLTIVVQGWSYGTRWNGWACPWINRDALDAVIANMGPQDGEDTNRDYWQIKWDGDDLLYTIKDRIDEYEQELGTAYGTSDENGDNNAAIEECKRNYPDEGWTRCEPKIINDEKCWAFGGHDLTWDEFSVEELSQGDWSDHVIDWRPNDWLRGVALPVVADDIDETRDMADEVWTASWKRLAVAFVTVVREWMDEEYGQYADLFIAEIVRRNRTRKTGICHTHDFIDSNMAMNDAFKKTFGCNWDLHSDTQNDVVNTAWEVAMGNDFKPVAAEHDQYTMLVRLWEERLQDWTMDRFREVDLTLDPMLVEQYIYCNGNPHPGMADFMADSMIKAALSKQGIK